MSFNSVVILFFEVSLSVSLSLSAYGSEPVQTDPAPNHAAALSFSEAYGRILGRNLNVQSQSLNVEIARAKTFGRIGAFTPSLNLIGNETRASSFDAYPFQGHESAALSLGANLFRSGTDYAALKGARRDVDASREILRDEKLKAEDDAAVSLLEFIKRTRERDLIREIVGLKKETVKIAHARYSRGLLAQQEVDKLQIDLDNSQARLIDAEVSLGAARATVSSRLGAFQSVSLDWPWKAAIVMGPKPEAFEFKLENRPDFRASLQSLEAESWRRHAARSLLLPSLDLTASYGSGDLSQTDRRDWSAVLTLKIPLFEEFAGFSAARIQTLISNQAEITRESITRNAGAEFETFRVSFTEARTSAVAREATSKLTLALYTDNLQRFRLGRASADELAIDQNRLLEAQILEVEGWTSAHLSFVRLCHALGHSVSASGECQNQNQSQNQKQDQATL